MISWQVEGKKKKFAGGNPLYILGVKWTDRAIFNYSEGHFVFYEHASIRLLLFVMYVLNGRYLKRNEDRNGVVLVLIVNIRA